MIDLQLKAEFAREAPPFVAKVHVAQHGGDRPASQYDAIAVPHLADSNAYRCRTAHGDFVVRIRPGDTIDGDVVLCVPRRNVVLRLFRRASRSNTLLFTERCDQLCAMCSQPPKNSNDGWRFPLYEQALLLADADTVVGISGGEPTLYKDALFAMIDRVGIQRSDLRYHILTNGQHFAPPDRPALRRLQERAPILWGIPLYSHREETHDEIVGKTGAFRRLLDNLLVLGSTGAQIELRTVITSLNVYDLPALADFVSKNIPFISTWAIMGMEPIGYARPNWNRLFFDHSVFPEPVVGALEIGTMRGLRCNLYNVPRCTIPERYRSYCADSISDWKKKYLPECAPCGQKAYCCGFFEWYNATTAWSGVGPI